MFICKLVQVQTYLEYPNTVQINFKTKFGEWADQLSDGRLVMLEEYLNSEQWEDGNLLLKKGSRSRMRFCKGSPVFGHDCIEPTSTLPMFICKLVQVQSYLEYPNTVQINFKTKVHLLLDMTV
ncbi:uncharacterized protein [Montipora capricornis]|uniref:uncharacterized protein isoform X2 n=1 Tax=Montipora capricornis TaxID=246305 RepID=UPI0035F10264